MIHVRFRGPGKQLLASRKAAAQLAKRGGVLLGKPVHSLNTILDCECR